MPGTKKYTRKQMDAARDAAEKKFANRQYVTGIDVGYRWTDNKPTKELCVRVHVKEKVPVSALEAAEVFPSKIEGVPLDVIQGDYKIRRATNPTEHVQRFPILLGGISVAHKDVTAGTIGAMVIDQFSGRPAILSNWHVLAGPTGSPGDEILQPGPADFGINPRDSVATLGQSILDADGDAAIAHLNGTRPWMPFIFGFFSNPTAVRNSVLGEKLVKSGRTTAQTKAKVDGEGTYFISYQVQPGVMERKGIKGFKLVPEQEGNPNNEELSSGGDSGSLWHDPDSGHAVGLHFAGETSPNPRSEHAIACNMTSVVDRLNIRLATPEDMLGFANETMNNSAENRSTKQSNHIRGHSGTELSLPPDGPWGPRPWPPRGPWPWPPRGPYPPFPDPWTPPWEGVFGGEIPWPFIKPGDESGWDFRNLDAGSFDGGMWENAISNPVANFESTATQTEQTLAAPIVLFALKRNHNIQPDCVRPFDKLRKFAKKPEDVRNLAVSINHCLKPLGAMVTRDDCQECRTVTDLVHLVRSKL